MSRSLRRLGLVLVMAGSLFPLAAPAHASTCKVSDPDLEYVVCDTVVEPTMRVVCTVVNKAKLDCFA